MGGEKRIRELYEKALRKPASLKFRELWTLAEGVGFRLDRTCGSHHIFIHKSSRTLLNFQNVKGQAKPYQVRQLLALIKEHNLLT
jgi:predicted RNA binding protein YcfA (HicA-like mRNA interferase family)